MPGNNRDPLDLLARLHRRKVDELARDQRGIRTEIAALEARQKSLRSDLAEAAEAVTVETAPYVNHFRRSVARTLAGCQSEQARLETAARALSDALTAEFGRVRTMEIVRDKRREEDARARRRSAEADAQEEALRAFPAP